MHATTPGQLFSVPLGSSPLAHSPSPNIAFIEQKQTTAMSIIRKVSEKPRTVVEPTTDIGVLTFVVRIRRCLYVARRPDGQKSAVDEKTYCFARGMREKVIRKLDNFLNQE